MFYLALVSLLWAFSFGLIGNALAGLDPFFVATVRLGLALLVFLPFLRAAKISTADTLRLLSCGAVQFGLMYVSYIQAFHYLPSHLVALFSVLTPLYVVLIHDIRHRRFTPRYLGAAALSVAGAAIIKAKSGHSDTLWTGFALMQVAGLAFAFGQVTYRDWKRQHSTLKDREVFALLYAGGALFALGVSLALTDWTVLAISASQWRVLLYLGVIASGIGFFLWNKGAALSSPGTLAAFNNAVVPLAVLCSLFVFDEIQDSNVEALIRLGVGAGCIAGAVVVGRRDGGE